MALIEIPEPDFSFEDVIKRRASETIKDRLSYVGFNGYIDDTKRIQQSVLEQVDLLPSIGHKLVYISALINKIFLLKSGFNKSGENSLSSNNKKRSVSNIIASKQIDEANEKFNDVLYFLYNLLSNEGYILDKNTFSSDEVSDLDRKINAILIKLDEIQVGNEVIFNEVEELKEKLKEDFESLKSDYPLGKKRWYQRAAGVVVSYSGTKGADEVYEQLKPQLHDFFINQAPHLVHKLIS